MGTKQIEALVGLLSEPLGTLIQILRLPHLILFSYLPSCPRRGEQKGPVLHLICSEEAALHLATVAWSMSVHTTRNYMTGLLAGPDGNREVQHAPEANMDFQEAQGSVQFLPF